MHIVKIDRKQKATPIKSSPVYRDIRAGGQQYPDLIFFSFRRQASGRPYLSVGRDESV